MSFKELNLHPSLNKALENARYKKPTDIQSQAIPIILARKDVMGCAHTGTGKTAAFVLPILHQISEMLEQKSISKKEFKGLVLAPTRELALQTVDYIEKLAKYTKVKHVVVYGGVDIENQILQIRKVRPQIIVATPGRFLEIYSHRFISLKHIKFFVLDEADRMLDMGFRDEIRKIERLLPKNRQTLLFSATLNPKIQELAKGMLRSPVYIDTNPEKNTRASIQQKKLLVDEADKLQLLLGILKKEVGESVLVFCQTKESVHALTEDLKKYKIHAEALHGDRSQKVRFRILDEFINGELNVLVATDIAARGLDIDGISTVINYSVPLDTKVYVHRIGRTGRAAQTGKAYTFVAPEDKPMMQKVEEFIEQEVAELSIKSFLKKK